MTELVKYPSSTGDLSGAFAAPAGDAKVPGVVVIQEYWGVNEQIQGVVQRWADAGFLALAPDLYHGKRPKNGGEASRMMSELDSGKAVQEIAAAVAFLREHPRSTGKIAVSGYCMGGGLSFAAAVDVRGLAAVVPYYGLPGDRDWSKIDAPIQAHFAKRDAFVPLAGAQKIKNAVKVPMELHVYDAQHAFCNDRRPEVYNPEAAQLAWDRSVAFVLEHTR